MSKGSGSKTRFGIYIEAGTKNTRAARKTWAERIAVHAKLAQAESGLSTFDCALEIEIDYRFLRPVGRRKHNEIYHSIKPDLDKLHRAVFDPLTKAGIIRDDCRFVRDTSAKRYTDDPDAAGVMITIRPVFNGEPIPTRKKPRGRT